MEILTAHTVNPDTQQAVSEALTQLLSTTDENIDLLIVYYTEVHDAAVLREALVTALPRVEMHGCSSCQGVMSQRGFHSEQGASLGLWAILDDDGDYGTAAVPLSNNLAETGERAVAEAMANAGRMGEVPELIWFSSTPGYEETLIESIQGVVGNNVPIAGGSAADNTVAGNWSLFNASQSLQEGLVVTLLYPSVNTSSAFLSGYSPTETSGVVTKAQGRTIIEIDGKPAAQVYNDWIGSPFEPKILDQGGNVLADTTLYPLGREASVVAGVQQFKLSHP
ncbi:MAG: FIST signal transduction protein, partial [Pontibacterium sp.]